MADLIYAQNQPGIGELPYGLRSTAQVGCGWVAAYNTLVLLGYHPSHRKLRRYFLWHGAVLFGLMGTILPAPGLYLQRLGHEVKFSAWRGGFDSAIRKADAAIVWYRWRKGAKFGAHFITVRWNGQEFIAYNLYSNSRGPEALGSSFSDFLRKKNVRCPVVATVLRKK